MIAAFFSRSCDAEDVFKELYISSVKNYKQYLNQFAVIHISFNDIATECLTYDAYIKRIEKNWSEI